MAAVSFAATIALWVAALPPPPTVVVRETRSFGTVNIDHAAHLARRAACSGCHVSGKVGPVVFATPKAAHEACRGCHVAVAKGPTECRGCHVVGPDAPARAAPAAAPVVAPAPGGAPPAGPAAGPGAPAPPVPSGVAPGLPAPPAAGPADGVVARSWRLDIGLASMAAGRQGVSMAPSFTLVGERGSRLLSHTLVLGGVTRGRTQFLVGAGKTSPLRPRTRWAIVGLGGIDATQRPVFMSPALGVRAALEFETDVRYVETISLSVSGVVALLSSNAVGERSGQGSLAFTLSGGLPLPR